MSAETIAPGSVSVVVATPPGEPPTASYRLSNGEPPPGAKCGTTTATATSETTVPATAIASPARRRPGRNAYQSPITATTSPICSFVRHASAGDDARTRRAGRSRGTRSPRGAGASRARRGGSRRGRATASRDAGGRRAPKPAAAQSEREVPAAEQVHGDRAGRDRERLGDEEHRRVGPQPPERGERGHDRVEMRPEPRDLDAREPGDGEEVAVRRRPDGLDEVPDVEAAASRTRGAGARRARQARPRTQRSPPDEPRRTGHRRAAARSSSDLQWAPSTSSDARAS